MPNRPTSTKERKPARYARTVRKTISLDGDLAEMVATFVIEQSISEKNAINRLIRTGLLEEREKAGRVRSPHKLPSFSKGIGDISRQDLNAMLDEI